MYSLPAEVIAAHPKSPVYQAGLRAGDKIVECNGVAIERQVQLKHVLGPLYSGEPVQLVTMRGNQRREIKVELVDTLLPYEHPFLGLLPVRNDSADQTGVGVRYVYPKGAVEKAGLKVGDRIIQLGGKPVENADRLRESIAALEPGKTISLKYVRDGKEIQTEAELGTLPNELPDAKASTRSATSTGADDSTQKNAPQKDDKTKDQDKEVAKGKEQDQGKKENAGNDQATVVEIKIPEEPNSCVALLPKSYRPEVPHGLVVYLPQPGEFKNESLMNRWQEVCRKLDLVVVAPRSVLPNMWLPTEVGFVRKAIDHCVKNYSIDRTRIVVHGYQASGSMAYLTAFRHRDLVRGVVAVDSAISAAARPGDNDPIERLAILTAVAEESRLKSRILAGVKALREMKYPVTVLEQPGEPRELNDQELNSVASWVDTLDRI
jgi:serine protease Do